MTCLSGPLYLAAGTSADCAPRWRRLRLPNMHIRPIPAVALASLLLLGAACAARAPRGNPTAALLTSLQATTVGDSVYFLLQLTNPGPEPVALELAADPPVQFVVRRGDLLLWDSAPDSRPTAEVAFDTLRAGDTRDYESSWSVPVGLRGTLTVTGAVRDRRAPLVQSTRFDLP